MLGSLITIAFLLPNKGLCFIFKTKRQERIDASLHFMMAPQVPLANTLTGNS